MPQYFRAFQIMSRPRVFLEHSCNNCLQNLDVLELLWSEGGHVTTSARRRTFGAHVRMYRLYCSMPHSRHLTGTNPMSSTRNPRAAH